MVNTVQKAPAESRYARELEALKSADDNPAPAGWALSPRAVRKFILGDDELNVKQKFFGDDPLVDRAIVSLMGHQGLMLVGEPGTAKSLLSELLATAIGGTSKLVVQGSAGIIEDHLRYGWNYAMLLAEGPSEGALVPSPILTAMREGKIARIEELTRCAPEIQDVMISLMSEKTVSVPELGSGFEYRASPGFNLIGTANLRDRGVHDMSSALKRRFNFETVHPIADPVFERQLIAEQVAERMENHPVQPKIETDLVDLVVSVFQDLRTGRTADGATVAVPNSVMSTAEAVNVTHAAMLEASYLGDGSADGGHIARQLGGVVFKDDPEDSRKMRAYADHVARDRARGSKLWKTFHQVIKTTIK